MIRLLVLLPLAALAVACGGGGDDDRLTKEELATRVNAICARVERQLDRLGEPSSLAEVAEFAGKATGFARKGVDDMRALRPPEDLESRYERFLDQGEQTVQLSIRLKNAAEEEDVEEFDKILEEAREVARRSETIARGLGFTECAEST